VRPTGLNTPEAIDLQRLFRAMLDAGDRSCAMEATSIAGVKGRLDGTRPGDEQPDGLVARERGGIGLAGVGPEIGATGTAEPEAADRRRPADRAAGPDGAAARPAEPSGGRIVRPAHVAADRHPAIIAVGTVRDQPPARAR